MPATNTVPHNLPVRLTSFVGRQRELATVSDLLAHNRLVTLTGAGGSGKTRLGVEAASELLTQFPDGIWFVDLAPVADPSLVANAIALAVGAKEVPSQPLVATLQRELRERHLLILLDNCEHLVSACADLADGLLRACPSIRVLATSREPLGVEGEVTWQVPSLTFPHDGADHPEELLGFEAVRLFVDRATKRARQFELTPEQGLAVAEICRRLDGIPLAIELAAARVATFSPRQIADRLTDRFGMLAGGARTSLPRHQTLEASVDWSYELLGERQRVLLGRLSVFRGGATLEAVENVCSGDPLSETDVPDLLSQLVDRSLVQVEGSSERPRYRLLETIREYARKKLESSGDDAAFRDRHLAFYAALAELADPEIEGAKDLAWLDIVETELDNIRVASDWALLMKRLDDGLRLVGSLDSLWAIRGHFTEGRNRLEAMLALEGGDPLLRARAAIAVAFTALYQADIPANQSFGHAALAIGRDIGDVRTTGRALGLLGWGSMFVDPPAALPLIEQAAAAAEEADDTYMRVMALAGVGYVRVAKGEADEARRVLEEGLAAARRSGYQLGTELCLTWLALLGLQQGHIGEAHAQVEESIEVARLVGDRVFIAWSLTLFALILAYEGDYARAEATIDESLQRARDTISVQELAYSLCIAGQIASLQGDFTAASAFLDEGIPLLRAMGFRWTLAHYLSFAAGMELRRGNHEEARKHAEEALGLARELGDPFATAMALNIVGSLERAGGSIARAEGLLHEALELGSRLGSASVVVDVLESLASVAALQESFKEAARLFGAAQRLRDSSGLARPPSSQPAHEEDVALVRQGLGDGFESAWAEGQAMSQSDAVAYATRARGERKRPSVGWASLTPMELQVVKLASKGLTNPQIGERLFISKRTVQAHLSHVFAKLGISTRTELATEAVRRGLGVSEAVGSQE